jgi:hypothetical protein
MRGESFKAGNLKNPKLDNWEENYKWETKRNEQGKMENGLYIIFPKSHPPEAKPMDDSS